MGTVSRVFAFPVDKVHFIRLVRTPDTFFWTVRPLKGRKRSKRPIS